MTALRHIVGIGAAFVLACAPAVAQNGQQGQPGVPPAGSQQQRQLQRQQQQRQADRAMTQERTLDHARMQTRDRDQAQGPARQQTQQQARSTEEAKANAATGVYGGNLMTGEERSRYRAQVQVMRTEQQRTEFEARHREQMQARGRDKGIEPAVTAD